MLNILFIIQQYTLLCFVTVLQDIHFSFRFKQLFFTFKYFLLCSELSKTKNFQTIQLQAKQPGFKGFLGHGDGLRLSLVETSHGVLKRAISHRLVLNSPFQRRAIPCVVICYQDLEDQISPREHRQPPVTLSHPTSRYSMFHATVSFSPNSPAILYAHLPLRSLMNL